MNRGDYVRQSIDFIELKLPDNRLCKLRIKQHHRAKRLSLRLALRPYIHICVTKPSSYRHQAAINFAVQQMDWIMSVLPQPQELVDGSCVNFRGEEYRIFFAGNALRSRVWIEADRLHVSSAAILCEHAVKRWLKYEAGQRLPMRVQYYANLLECQVGNVKLCDHISHWGRCNAKGDITMSWRLIMAPDFVSDYVAAHEVAHLVELNHSINFWKIVDSLISERKNAQKWLQDFGLQLQLY